MRRALAGAPSRQRKGAARTRGAAAPAGRRGGRGHTRLSARSRRGRGDFGGAFCADMGLEIGELEFGYGEEGCLEGFPFLLAVDFHPGVVS